ncbi:oligosaccharide flippase family protein [Bacillus haikouensis]|jgi:O-antigen/teichoic acid export membrane protein|uniref:lipopolysaccharide biosynthesis protein n=1 Tax=Bacillus haikouensis TaxID=1510468 RepID=UPI0015524A1E|nr:oligosaccharide flippase family protein [Bacillus haikouensis]NQD67785.1 oligosaccharide flippase family protein [Bacillus haikouensis]
MNDNLFNKFLKFSYGSWVGLLLGLVTTMIVTRIISPSDLGKASMFDVFIQVGMILTIFGTDQAFVRFFYEEHKDHRGTLLFNTLRIPILTTLVLISIIFYFYRPITVFLFEAESLPMAFVLAAGILVQILLRFGQLVIRMQQKGNLYSLLQIFQKIFNLFFIGSLLYLMGAGFEVLIFSKLFTLIVLVVIAIYFGKNYWNISYCNRKGAMHSQKDILKYGAPFVLTIFISWLFEAFDKIALRNWSTFEELGLYSAAMRLVALVLVVRTTFSTFWTPIAYERFEERPDDKKFFWAISILVSYVMFFVAIVSIISKDLIVVLLGNNYSTAATIMPFLVFMPIFYTISETTVIGINFYKKINWHIFIAGISCVFNIMGNWLLVPSYGALGASIATAFSYVIFFTLRTHISLLYYKVNYPLVRIYLMVVVVSVYAFISINIESILGNVTIGFLSLFVLTSVFYKDIISILRNRNELLDNK